MEQIRNLDQLLVYAKEVGPKKISVACAEDAEVMEAVENARKAGIANAFLVGNADKIKEVTDKLGIDLANYEIVDERGGEAAAALKAVELVSSGEAQIVMKGMVATANFLRGVLNKEKGLRSGKTLSHVYIHQIKGYARVFFISDPAFNMYPELKVKVDIVKNVVELAHAFGVACTKV
ncbi:MAG: phosphate butyryltransferase, partial [Cloacibacillus porcorum]|nr:phosphate butyryltransferase [Cloacibacillus porcorum]